MTVVSNFCFIILLISISKASLANSEILRSKARTATVSRKNIAWECVQKRCSKVVIGEDNADSGNLIKSLQECKFTCGNNGLVWPKPTEFLKGNAFSSINLNEILLEMHCDGSAQTLLIKAFQNFKYRLPKTAPEGVAVYNGDTSLRLKIYIDEVNLRKCSLPIHNFCVCALSPALKLETDESYYLRITETPSGIVNVTITANNFFGARHGLETLSQLVIYDENLRVLKILRQASITDIPAYPYRGIMIDTSRNYHSIESIKRTIDAMSTVKLNSLHWHLTDTHSFPFVSKRHPELSILGAYSPEQVYTIENIRDIIQYALVRGVRVIPELDTPSHVGEGWQNTDYLVCFKQRPWSSYCKEPPCGQLDPTKEGVYEFLGDIYKDMFEAFEPVMFHMGGDEVSKNCWLSEGEIKNFMKGMGWSINDEGFLKLWGYFQLNAAFKVFEANNGTKLPIILWSNTLNEFKHIDDFLNKEDYVIQLWTTKKDPEIKGLLDEGYRIIMSNYDTLYLDCGFESWTGEGNNWCSPYSGWKKIYNNHFNDFKTKENKHLILGGEAALWSEESDAFSLDTKLWPRAAALAERLWSDPSTGWKQANQRFLHIRDRLQNYGINADSVQPLWCYQNEDQC